MFLKVADTPKKIKIEFLCTFMVKLNYPETKKVKYVDNYHGTKVVDNYRWLENCGDKRVKEWIANQEKLSRSIIDNLPQKKKIVQRLNELWRYDAETIPWEVLNGKRIFFHKRKKNDEKWVYSTKEDEKSEEIELINPNYWEENDSLSFAQPSSDGKFLAFGKEKGGNENPVIQVMEIATKEILNDSVTGWKQGRVAWLHDNSGFFYSRKPLKGEVKKGEEYYWDGVYFHELGTNNSKDKKIFYHDSVKEYYHTAYLDELGMYVIFVRTKSKKNEVFFKKIKDDELIPIATGFDAEYDVQIVDEKILIQTDLDSPNGKVYVTDTDKPERKYWKELIPESSDKLVSVSGIFGKLFVKYLHRAYSITKIYSLDGSFVKNVTLPGFGDSSVHGYWSKPNIWIRYSSFITPYATYKYNMKKDELELYFKPPVNIDSSKYITKQVEYSSKDGTKITMFLIYNKNLKKDGENPAFLTGYGGFNISMTPHYSLTNVIWPEAGGIVAIPNLRGGGEYGAEWHEAGKLEKKQNVFDDFIAAAEWLIENKYTSPNKLSISGGSNGGLLVGAVAIQKPNLFRAVDCGVPLLDMLRYHKLSIANTWAVEYGSSENPEQFEYLHKYSPYHNVKEGVDYPAMLITTSKNDARVDPMHALKMIARLQEVNPNGGPFLLLVRGDSGHRGGTTISNNINQISEELSFLMNELNMVYN